MWKTKEKADHQVIPDLECDPVPGLGFGGRKKYVSIWDKVEVLLGCQRRNVQKVVGVRTSGSGKILRLDPKMIQESPDIGVKWSCGKEGWSFRAGPAPYRPARQVQRHLFGEESFVATQLCYLFRYCFRVRLCYSGVTLWVLGTKTQWLTKSEILTVWPLAEKVLQSLLWEFGSPEGGTLSKMEHLWMSGS